MPGPTEPAVVQALNAEIIRRLDAAARAGFTYKPDAPGTNPWRSFAAEAEHGQAWAGECADLSSTVLQMLFDAGEPLVGLFRLVVDSTRCGHADHMIAATRDDTGQWWVIGDTFDPAYIAQDCPHRPVQFQCMSDITTWTPGAPWG